MLFDGTKQEAIVLEPERDRVSRVSLARPLEPLAILEEPELAEDGPLMLGDHLTEEGLLVCGRAANQIELRRWDDFSLAAQIKLGRATCERWVSIAVAPAGDHLAVADSMRRVRLLDLSSRLTGMIELERGEVLSMRFSPDGRRLAIATTSSRGAQVSVWDVEGARGKVYLAALDRRVVPHSVRSTSVDVADLCFTEDGEILYLYTSTSSLMAPPEGSSGWRGSLEAHDIVDGKLWWCSNLDAEVTGDPRSNQDLGLEHGFATRMLLDETQRELILGTTGGGVAWMDARDGALHRFLAPGGAQGIAQIASSSDGDFWLLTSRGQLLDGASTFLGA